MNIAFSERKTEERGRSGLLDKETDTESLQPERHRDGKAAGRICDELEVV